MNMIPAVPTASPFVPYIHRTDTVLSTTNASANTVPNNESSDCMDLADHTPDLFSVKFDAISVGVFSCRLYNQFSSILTWKYRQLEEDQPYSSQNSFFWPPKKIETTTRPPSVRYPQIPMQVSIQERHQCVFQFTFYGNRYIETLGTMTTMQDRISIQVFLVQSTMV